MECNWIMFCLRIQILFAVHHVSEASSYSLGDGIELLVRIPRGRIIEKGSRGPTGRPGPPGKQGETGDRGRPGRPGGPGELGPTGSIGEPGILGERGMQGDKGIGGPNGPTGPSGIPGGCVQSTPGQFCLRGPDGRQGPKGSIGEKGNKGRDGEEGLRGAKGKQGPKGFRGERGLTGPPGTVAGPVCGPRYSDWVKITDFKSGLHNLMCTAREFLWNVETELNGNALRYKYFCCEIIQA